MLPLPETPLLHSKEDAYNQDTACLKELLFPHWFLRELTQLLTFAEQVSKVLGEGKSVAVNFSMVLWLL